MLIRDIRSIFYFLTITAMFKGKVTISKNGKTIEKEFTDPKAYEEFIKVNNLNLDWWWDERGINPRLWFSSLNNFHRYLDEFFNKKLWLWYESNQEIIDDIGVDVNKYEQELQKIEYDKTHKEEKKKTLENTLHKLKEYEKKFHEEDKNDMLTNVKEDIKKVESELKKLENKN